jgi:hypothetical protein
MFKLKRVLVTFLIVAVILAPNLLVVSSKSEITQSTKQSFTTTSKQGYILNWQDMQGDKVLVNVKVGKDNITYIHNNLRNRIVKKLKQGNISFTYDNESRLITETRDNNDFTYLYDSLYSLIGFTLNNTVYYFAKDSDFNVTAITDSNNNEVAKYEYGKDGIVSAILGKDSMGNWVDMSKDSSFVGTLNLIRLHSYYYDAETGWYYDGLYYYDSTNNEYIVPNVQEDTIQPLVTQELVIRISNWRDSLMNDSNFGKPISYSTGWYNGLSDVEIIARCLYGENTVNSADQNSCAWIMINRRNKNSSEFGGSTYRGVVKKPGAFEPITGGSGGTANARIPDKSSPRWRNAVWNACTLLSTSNQTDYAELITKPNTITNQLFFTGLNYFLGNSIDASPTGTGLLYNMGGSYIKTKDVVIVFNSAQSLHNPSSKSAITSDTRLDTYSERSTHNIFFNLN